MKLSFSFFLTILILIFALLFFGSCKKPEAGTNGTENGALQGTHLGQWYCEQAMMALEIKSDNTFVYYGLVPDDYVYGEDSTVGGYTLTDNKISLVLDDLALDLVYDAEKDILTIDGSTATFTRVDQLPAKLPTPDPSTFKGVWYSEDSLSVLHIKDDNTFDSYAIKAGYYSYTSMATGSYEINESTISTKFGEEEYIALYYNPNKDNISTIYGQLYVRAENNKCPEQHPVVLFPDFTEMDCASVITLGNYKGLEIAEKAGLLAKLNIFEAYYKEAGATKPAITEARAAQLGDQVVIDYTGYLNGEAFQGGAAKGQVVTVMPDSGYIEGFAEGIAGHKVGETFDVNVTFPENYGNAEMAGKAVVFTMTLHTIYDLSLNDEQITSLSKNEFKTYDEMVADQTKGYRSQLIWTEIEKNTKLSENLPLEYYEHFYAYYRDSYHAYAFNNGITYDELLTQMKITDESLKEETKKVTLPYLITQTIYEKEGIAWDEKVYEETLALFIQDAKEYFKYETEEEAKEFVLEQEENNLKISAMKTMVTNWLLENND